MASERNKLRIVLSCAIIALPAFLCGCQSSEEREAEACLQQANSNSQDGRFKEAIPFYEKAIALKPDYADAYYFMGLAYRKLDRYPDAIASLKKAIALKPNYANAYYFMGIVYHASEKYPEAIDALKKAIALKPDYADAYCFMGLSHEKLKQDPEALAALEKYRDLKPSGRLLSQVNRKINEISNRKRP